MDDKELKYRLISQSIGIVYINKLIPDEKVVIEDMESREMWGQTGKEHVTIVKYVVIEGMKKNTGFGGETTLHNFLMKYEDIQTIRDNKLNQILGE